VNRLGIVAQVDGYVGRMQEVVREILLDHIAFVTEADNELVNAVCGKNFHDVPKDWLAADLYHGLRAHGRFLAESAPKPSRQNDRLHQYSPLKKQATHPRT
jgi:hypothetical protein